MLGCFSSIDVIYKKIGVPVREEKSPVMILTLTFSSNLDWVPYIISIAKKCFQEISTLDSFYEVSFS